MAAITYCDSTGGSPWLARYISVPNSVFIEAELCSAPFALFARKEQDLSKPEATMGDI